jgi:hypothetical protein
VPKEGVVEEEGGLFVKEIEGGTIVDEGPIKKTSSRSFNYFRELPSKVLVVLVRFEGSSKGKDGDKRSGNEVVITPISDLDLSAEIDETREIIPDELFAEFS